MMGVQHDQMREDMETLKSELQVLRKENANLKVSSSKSTDYQSAMASNNAAIQEKISESNRLVKEKQDELNAVKDRLGKLEMENA